MPDSANAIGIQCDFTQAIATIPISMLVAMKMPIAT